MRWKRSCRVHEPMRSEPTEATIGRHLAPGRSGGSRGPLGRRPARRGVGLAVSVVLMGFFGAGVAATAAAAATGTWAVTSAPSQATATAGPPLSATVAQVACPGPGVCIAVGESSASSATSSAASAAGLQPLAQGAGATAVTGTTTTTATTAATAATDATATTGTPGATGATATAATGEATSTPLVGQGPATQGASTSPTSSSPFADVLSDGAWTETALPLPANAAGAPTATADLTGLSCPSTTFCVATGMYEAATGADQGLIETMSAGAWTAAAAPLPGGGDGPTGHSYLEAVSCSGAGACVAVGWYREGLATYALVDELAATGWSALSAPQAATAPTDPRSYLVSVTCPAAGTCVGVGFANDATGGTAPLVAHVADGAVSAELLDVPGGDLGAGTTNHLQAVACGAPGTCAAVGTYRDGAGTTTALGAVLSAGTWSAAQVPLPADAASTILVQANLDAVSCSGPGSCVAGGFYHDVTGGFPALVATLSSSAWTSTAAPDPSGALGSGTADGTVGALTCSSAGRCQAVGEYASGGSFRSAVVESYATGTWTAAPLPAPSGGGAESLLSLSCRGGVCAASGWYVAATGATPGLLAWEEP